MTAAIVSGRRTVAPHGLDGGRPGLCGRNAVVRAGMPGTDEGRADDRAVARGVPDTGTAAAEESQEEVGGVARLELRAGDAVLIETPGGGGFGAPPDAPGTRV